MIVTVPLITPEAKPVGLMVAIAVSEELQTTELVRSLLLPSENLPVALNCCVAPAPIAIVPGDTCRLLKEAGAGVGVGDGVGVATGVGVGVGPPERALLELFPPPPPHPLNTRQKRTKAAKINFNLTLISQAHAGHPSNTFKTKLFLWGNGHWLRNTLSRRLTGGVVHVRKYMY